MDFITGDGTQIRVAALVAGSRARPVVGSFKTLKGVTTSDLKLGASDVTTTTYDTDKAEDGKVTKTNWGFSVSGNVPLTTANREALAILKDAAKTGDEAWVERLLPDHTEWEGGVASIMSYSEPAPADGIITFSADVKGRGAFIETATT